ncbi:MAG: hypothetical protein ACXWH1_15710, partial [Thermoanaerobaculia bacterium]
MRPAHLALGISAEHPRNLGHSRRSIEHRDVRRGNSAPRALGNDDVVVSSRRDLWKVGYREDLVLFRDATEGVADLQAHAAAD